jgi:hypothetical protein
MYSAAAGCLLSCVLYQLVKDEKVKPST